MGVFHGVCAIGFIFREIGLKLWLRLKVRLLLTGNGAKGVTFASEFVLTK